MVRVKLRKSASELAYPRREKPVLQYLFQLVIFGRVNGLQGLFGGGGEDWKQNCCGARSRHIKG